MIRRLRRWWLLRRHPARFWLQAASDGAHAMAAAIEDASKEANRRPLHPQGEQRD